MPELYYIQNTRSVVGNSALWWRIDGHGYTCDLSQAWKVTKQKAEGICRDRPEQDVMHKCSVVDALAERHVDVQRLNDGSAMDRFTNDPVGADAPVIDA